MENPLWAYSLTHYRRTGVERACLQLQDGFDLDVNLLLYAAWLASEGQSLTQTHLNEVEEAVSQWRHDVIQPLRDVRRRLKSIPGAQSIRSAMAELELEAEAQQQALIFTCYQNAAIDRAYREDNGKNGGEKRGEKRGEYLNENLKLVALQTSSAQTQWEPLLVELAAALSP